MMKKIVAIGGGSGLATLLQGLKKYPFDISAIVTMTDDGLSSGRLRRDFGILPPGDVRKCILALSEEESLLKKLFSYRFKRGRGLSGQSLGNLLILGLEKITGNLREGIAAASKILSVQGKVTPSTYENLNLVAYLKSGKKIIGERKAFLAGRKDPIQKIELTNFRAKANPDAIKAIEKAEAIIIGPGSLFTSIIPNFLIRNITRAIIQNKKAKKIYICNVSTERGETQKYSVEDHIRKLIEHSDPKIFQFCLVNNKIIKVGQKEHKLGEVKNISTDKKKILNYQIIKTDLINDKLPLYHDSQKLTKVLKRIINGK